MMTSRKNFRRPTINDVAQLAGVSKSTVSRVMSGRIPVNVETAARVQQAIAELNYTPSATAQALSDRRTYAIGLLVQEIAAPYFVYLLRGIERAAREAGYGLLINSVYASADQTQTHRPFLGAHNTDGLIIFSSSLRDEEMRRLSAQNFPLVLLHRTPPNDVLIPAIHVDNRAGAYAIIEHLITVHGCRRIAFLRGPATEEDSVGREQGYRDALQAHGIASDPALVGYGGFSEHIAYRTVSQWVADGLTFDAIFAGDDEAAPGVFRALREAGLSVPDDVAVVGFDDDYLAPYLVPALTTVRSFIEQVGQQAVLQLIRLINGQPAASQMLPTELIIRQSCGCVQADQGE